MSGLHDTNCSILVQRHSHRGFNVETFKDEEEAVLRLLYAHLAHVRGGEAERIAAVENICNKIAETLCTYCDDFEIQRDADFAASPFAAKEKTE